MSGSLRELSAASVECISGDELLGYVVLSRNAIASVVQVIVTGLSLFLLYRLLVHGMGPSAVGLWSVVLAVANMTRLGDLGAANGIVKFVANDCGAGRIDAARQDVVMGLGLALGTVGVLLLSLYFLSPLFLEEIFDLPEAISAATEIIPVVLFSVWVASGAAVIMGALDGLQRIDIRAGIVCFGAIVQLFTTWWLIPQYGLQAVALGHLAQSGVTFILAAAALCIKLGSILPTGAWINRKRLRGMLVYGSGIQISSIAQMLFEPVLRVLLARYGTLPLVGYYEMASRVVFQARSLLVAGCQPLIPHVALVHARDGKEPVKQIYLDAYVPLSQIAIPFFAVLLVTLPLVSHVWLGRQDDDFLLMGAITVVMWAANALIVPAYYVFLGIGRVRWTTTSQVVVAIANVVLALLLGMQFGGYGVAIGGCLAVIVGSAVVVIGLHREENIPLRKLCPPMTSSTLLSVLMGPAAFVILFAWGKGAGGLSWSALAPAVLLLRIQ